MRPKTPPMTSWRASAAKFLVLKLGLFQHQAAAILGVNQGRISEVITGKRFKEAATPDQLDLDID